MRHHLVVLVHGLWGNPSHFDYVSQQVELSDLSTDIEKIVIYRTNANEGYKTLDGIDVCGFRVASEIQEKIKQIREAGGEVAKLSIIGYSLGGLISRYAIGILEHQNVFESIEAVNFTTFCTPHVGVLTPGNKISVKIFNSFIPKVLSLSGRQMFLKDESSVSDKISLLSLMANEKSIFYKSLKRFKYRSLYANAINDKRTSWWTSGISVVDPFLNIDENSKLDELNFKYIEGFDPIVIDANAKFNISNIPIQQNSAKTQPLKAKNSTFWRRKWNWVVVFTNLVFFAPLWVAWFLVSNVLESYKSHRRIDTTLRNNKPIFSMLSELSPLVPDESLETDSSDVNSIADSLKSNIAEMRDEAELNIQKTLEDRADTLMESVWDAMTSRTFNEVARLHEVELISTGPDDIIPEFSDLKTSISIQDTIIESINKLSFFEKDSPESRNEVLKRFTLDLYPNQLEIVKSLNKLEWQKYPILIRHTKSTHSAAIVRNIDDEELYEGKTVIDHWLHNVFKLE